jgi:hypothetical protein
MDARKRREDRSKPILLAGVFILVVVGVSVQVIRWVDSHAPESESHNVDPPPTAAEIAARDADLKLIAPGMTLAEAQKRLGGGGYSMEMPTGMDSKMYKFWKPAYGRYFIIVTVNKNSDKVVSAQYWAHEQ